MRSFRSAAAGLALTIGLASVPTAHAVERPPITDPARELTAPMALLIDLGSGRTLFERDSRRRFLPASLTKIMTAYVAFELIAHGKLQPNQRFTMSNAAFDKWHRVGSTMFIARGQQVSVDELINGIMTVSGNDGCIVLAEGAAGSVARFVALMNAEARELGMRDSHFGSPNGWPDEGATYTSARDLAVLTQAMLTRHPALYRHYVGHAEMSFNGIRQSNHVPLIGKVPGADGVKTGFTNESGYGVVGSAVRNGRRLVLVTAGYDRAFLRARESRDLIEWGFNAWDARRLFAKDATVGEARVQQGAARHVPLVAPMPYFLTLARGERPAYRLALHYDGPLRAPVAKGARVGELVVTMEGQAPYRLPLVTARAVERAGPWARLRNGLLGLIEL